MLVDTEPGPARLDGCAMRVLVQVHLTFHPIQQLPPSPPFFCRIQVLIKFGYARSQRDEEQQHCFLQRF